MSYRGKSALVLGKRWNRIGGNIGTAQTLRSQCDTNNVTRARTRMKKALQKQGFKAPPVGLEGSHPVGEILGSRWERETSLRLTANPIGMALGSHWACDAQDGHTFVTRKMHFV